jgi:hypothetical protein
MKPAGLIPSPGQGLEADQRAGQVHEPEQDVGALFVADLQAGS